MNFSGKFGSDQTIWYPASSIRRGLDGSLVNVGSNGDYWSASPDSKNAYLLGFSSNGSVDPSGSSIRADGQSVRCLQE